MLHSVTDNLNTTAPTCKYFAVKFPQQRSDLTVASGNSHPYETYSRDIGMEDGVLNEWAPFSSRVEWELARWAKLRGPSAGALDRKSVV